VKFARHVKILQGRPDAVPFVSVFLLLLLFFIIATRFVQEPGISIRLPEATATSVRPAAFQVPLIITISAPNPDTGRNSIYFDDEIVDIPKLRASLLRAAQQSPSRECVVKADKRAPHGLVVTVLGVAQEAGLKSVRIATQLPEQPVRSP
jgi:biopolymer transport protein ExbD